VPDAKTLAEAGPLVLELLPGPEGLSEEEALGVTVTASLLGADEPTGALGVLRRFRSQPDLSVRRQLVGTWSRFDTEVYAAEVLDHLDREGLFLTCESAEQRAALGRLRPWQRVSFRGDHPMPDVLATLPAPETMTHLDLRENADIDDLRVLLPFHSLNTLSLDDCPWAYGADRLAPLPLVDLSCSGVASLKGVGALDTLRRLSLDGELAGGDRLTDCLPVGAPLEFLHLSNLATIRTGLRGLEHWTGLTELSLVAPPEATDWGAVARLPSLTTLRLNAGMIKHFPEAVEAMPELPTIGSLHLSEVHGGTDLSLLASRLPGLRHVTLRTRSYFGENLPTGHYADLFPGATVDVVRR